MPPVTVPEEFPRSGGLGPTGGSPGPQEVAGISRSGEEQGIAAQGSDCPGREAPTSTGAAGAIHQGR